MLFPPYLVYLNGTALVNLLRSNIMTILVCYYKESLVLFTVTDRVLHNKNWNQFIKFWIPT